MTNLSNASQVDVLQIELCNLLTSLEDGNITLNEVRTALSGYTIEQLQIGTGSIKVTKRTLIQDVLKPYEPQHKSEKDKIKLPTKTAIRNEAAKQAKQTYKEQTQSLSKLVKFIHENKDLCEDVTNLLKVDNLPMSFVSSKNLLNIWADMDKIKNENYVLSLDKSAEDIRVYQLQLSQADGTLSRECPKIPNEPNYYLTDKDGNKKDLHTFNAVVEALKFAGKHNK